MWGVGRWTGLISGCLWAGCMQMRWLLSCKMPESKSPRLISPDVVDFLKLMYSQPVIQFRSLKDTCLRLSGVQVSCFMQWKFKKSGNLDISVKILILPEIINMILGKSHHFNQKWEIELFTSNFLLWGKKKSKSYKKTAGVEQCNYVDAHRHRRIWIYLFCWTIWK